MKNKIPLTILAILGLICTVKLSVIFYQSNYNPYAHPSFCSINNYVDCDAVAATTKSVFLGIPLSYWGMFLYLFILLLLNVEKISQIKGFGLLKVFKTPVAYISSLALISVVISVWLAITSFFIIRKLCILCFVTYLINLLIAIFSTEFKTIKTSFKTSYNDFICGVKEYPIQFVLAVLIGVCFLTYTTVCMPFASKNQSIKRYLKLKKNPYPAYGNVLGNPSGKYKAELYTDYTCPYCFFYHIMIHKLVKENKQVYIKLRNFPLDIECNKYIGEQMHPGACRMARYSIAAENQGKYLQMATSLFETKPKTDKEAIELAKSLGLDIEKFMVDINSDSTKMRLKQEIDHAISQEIDGTPTLVVKGNHYVGLKPYYEFKRIIEGR